MKENSTYVIGGSRGREGFDVTRFGLNGQRCRRNFADNRGLETFLGQEFLKYRMTIIPAKGLSGKNRRYVERLVERYG